MVYLCKSKGISAERIDAVSYLEKIDDVSLDGIFIDQVVEHLEPDYLARMIELCYRKLSYGGVLVIETVNPLSFVSLANFYIDMSHKSPIHPETLKYMLESFGFRDLKVEYSSPVPEELRLARIDPEGIDEKNRPSIEVYNHNIDIINNVLFGFQDYAVIGRK